MVCCVSRFHWCSVATARHWEVYDQYHMTAVLKAFLASSHSTVPMFVDHVHLTRAMYEEINWLRLALLARLWNVTCE